MTPDAPRPLTYVERERARQKAARRHTAQRLLRLLLLTLLLLLLGILFRPLVTTPTATPLHASVSGEIIQSRETISGTPYLVQALESTLLTSALGPSTLSGTLFISEITWQDDCGQVDPALSTFSLIPSSTLPYQGVISGTICTIATPAPDLTTLHITLALTHPTNPPLLLTGTTTLRTTPYSPRASGTLTAELSGSLSTDR